MKKRVKTYTIGAVAEMYDIHPQTLLSFMNAKGCFNRRRSVGNTRLYKDGDYRAPSKLSFR